MQAIWLLIVQTLIKHIIPKIATWASAKRYFIFIALLVIPLLLSIIVGTRHIVGNDKYTIEDKRSLAEKLIKDLIIKCGDGSAISLSVVSINSDIDNFKNETFKAKFQVAYAMESNIMVDLKAQNPELYSTRHINIPMYRFLVSLDQSSLSTPATFNLESNRLYQQTSFSFINRFLSKTEWGQNFKLKKLYITSIIDQDPYSLSDKVIYTITFIKSIDFNPKNGCDEIISDFRNLRNEIKAL